ncbi:MAG: acyl carrier protein [Planctomycetes bacterium]|nr:acyl carrier protein [Planctomycetota bacterium]
MDQTDDQDPSPRAPEPGTQERIRRYVAVSFRDGRSEGLLPDTPLVSSGIVDSAGVLQLVEWLESAFGIAIPDEAVGIENFDSLRALARLVAELRAT